MSQLVVAPGSLTTGTADVDGVASGLDAARLAAARPTTALAAAAADEISTAVAELFAGYGQQFQALGVQTRTLLQQFGQSIQAAAESYAAAEATNSALMDATGFIRRQFAIYDFSDPRGWAALILDYTWGAPGTALGYGVQIVNEFTPNSNYDPALSALAGSHVYRGGIGLSGYATTFGNVTSNLGYSPKAADLMLNHEALHVWQNRLFGPLFSASYSAWTTGGTLVANGYWLLHPEEDLSRVITTIAYYDNPWETWAYRNDHAWPPPGAIPALLWPS
ncbi:PE family protein [Mycobacterium sp. 23]|uniref:PE family protein n=1 Tax=Mycobacterium sp. 23 TaxID=3400424 RepID=UPI003AAF5222